MVSTGAAAAASHAGVAPTLLVLSTAPTSTATSVKAAECDVRRSPPVVGAAPASDDPVAAVAVLTAAPDAVG